MTAGTRPTVSARLYLFALMLRSLRGVLDVSILVAGLVVLYLLVFGNFGAESSFAPQSDQNNLTQLAGIAAQFGVTLGQQSDQSVDFYKALLNSREVLQDVVTHEYPVVEDGHTVTRSWLDIMQITGDTPHERLLKGIDNLRDHMSVSTSILSGLVFITVVAPDGGLAEEVNRRLLEVVNAFNISKLQSEARAERQFVDDRLRHAEDQLRASEAALRRFLEVNHTYETSPRLVFEYNRLQRDIDLRQQVFVTLSQSAEQARINEVRNTPVITVIDGPEGSAKPSPDPWLVGPVVLILTIVIAGICVLSVGVLRLQRQRWPEEYGLLYDAAASAFPSVGGRLGGYLRRLLR